MPRIEGYLDGAEHGLAQGWALDHDRPDEPQVVQIVCDGQPAGTALANLFRTDLCRPDCGNGRGCYGFAFRLPHELRFVGRYALQAKVQDADLTGSPLGVVESVDLPYRLPPQDFRRWLAGQYLWGQGAELAALQPPLPVPPGARVAYLEWIENTQQGPKVRVGVDLLTSFPPGSLDFVILNHSLSYAPDPIGQLLTALSITRVGGVIYVATADRGHTPLRRHSESTWLELLHRHSAGPDRTALQRVHHWVRFAENTPEWDQDRRVQEVLADPSFLMQHSGWSPLGFLEFLASVRHVSPHDFQITSAHTIPGEAIAVIERA